MEYIHFPLHPETPQEGITYEELFAGRLDYLKMMKERLIDAFKTEGLPYADRSTSCNSRISQEVGKWADTFPDGYLYHDLMFKEYFVNKANIADERVILGVAEKAGLSVDEAEKVISERSFSKAVDDDWAFSRNIGVTGVPTFVANMIGVVGAQPYEELEALVIKSGAAKIS